MDRTLSRDECITLRDRMRARGASSDRSSSDGEGGEHGRAGSQRYRDPLLNGRRSPNSGKILPTGGLTRPLYSPSSHQIDPLGPPPQPIALQSMDQIRSLKERVYDRAGSASGRPPPFHQQSFADALGEPVKDVYVHERPFPVQAVYEVERVRPTRHISPGRGPSEVQGRTLSQTHTGYGGDSLLLPEDAAKLVKSLEDRHSSHLHRIATLENEVLELKSNGEKYSLEVQELVHRNNELAARNSELERQTSLVRGESRDIIETNNRQNDKMVFQAVEENSKKWQALEKGMQTEIKNLKKDLELVTRQKFEMERLVRELKEQLSQNAQSLQTGNETVRDLTKQLIAAKTQGTSVSNGYREIEKQLRSSNALCQAQKAELDALKNVHTELKELREVMKKKDEELTKTTKKLEIWKESESERQRLEQLSKMQAAEMTMKQKELQSLKDQLDTIKDQAHQAYIQSTQFNRMSAAGGYAPVGDDPLALLRREVEDEERRAADESRRWRTRLSSPIKL